MPAGAVVVLTPSPGDAGAASQALLQALLESAPEVLLQPGSTAGSTTGGTTGGTTGSAAVACVVRAAEEGGEQARARIAWREGRQLNSTLSPYPHLADLSKVTAHAH